MSLTAGMIEDQVQGLTAGMIEDQVQAALDRAGVPEAAAALLAEPDLRLYVREGCSASWLVSCRAEKVLIAHVYAPLKLNGELAEWFFGRLEADMLEVGATEIAWMGRRAWPRFYRRFANGRRERERSV